MDRNSGQRSSHETGPRKRPAEELDRIIDDFNEDLDDYLPPPPEEDVEINLGEAGRNWVRPKVEDEEAYVQGRKAIVFQQLDVDYLVSNPLPGFDKNLEQRQVPVVRMFGVNETGNSVCVYVHGFEPYFYVEKPKGWTEDDVELLRRELNKRLLAKSDKNFSAGAGVVRIETETRTSIWNYQFERKDEFLKIVATLPNQVAPLRGTLEAGFHVPDASYGGFIKSQTYESNVLFALRFMIDMNIVGGNWVELPAGSFLVPTHRATFCQLEAHVRYDRLISHPAEGEYSKLAPFRILSVDIECAGRKGCFPDAKFDPVIQIASMVTVQGSDTPLVRNVMTLGSCASIVGAEVMSFDAEAKLLTRWRDLLVEADPDIIIGYNICNFDLPYLFERAQTLKIDKEFHMWGRVRGSRTRMKDTQFSSKAYGTHEYKDLTIEGRVQFDLMMAIQRDYKLSSYSLNAVSAHFLGEQKEDVHHSCISDLQNGDEETRRRLAVYCLKDAYLPQRLLDKLMYMYNYIEMARVTGVPMSFLLSRGQSIKVYSQVLRKARVRGFLVPSFKSGAPAADGVGYEGATVLEPKIGFYEKPVATLDFASLYPSIMMAHNLCYSTLVPSDKVRDLPPEDLSTTPTGDVFVKPHRCQGILPEILFELIGARKRAKEDIKAEKDPFKRAVLDGRQLALKVSANSVYGFTGATVGKMPCLAISGSVTAYGRTMIERTKELVQATYNKANGYKHDCDVIYGDTDSVMVNFKVSDVAEAMELGRHAANFISSTFIKPVKLEFEKVYFPYLLMNKKRYAGLLWTKPERHDKMDSKGIETVRRDNCLLVRNVVTTCLEKILIDRDVPGATSYVKSVISDLLLNKIDLSLLVVSKGLTQEADKYKAKQAHVELATKMRKRDAATAPSIGDRVPFVIVKAAKGAQAYEKAEDPIYALEHNLPIDVQHYLEHHLSQPLIRIFEPVMKNPKELLTGDHTRTIAMSTPSMAAGGIMRFAKIRLACLSCKVPLSAANCKDFARAAAEAGGADSSASLCDTCSNKAADVYTRCLGQVNELEAQFATLWTQCQRCQGSLHLDVLCTSRDCPIFYRRKKVQKELNEVQAQLARFQDEVDW